MEIKSRAILAIIHSHCTYKKFSVKDFFGECDQIRSFT